MRILYNIVVLLSILFFPWWIFALVMILFVALVRVPYEILFWGLLIDSLFGSELYVFTWGASIALILSIFIKERLLFYYNN